VWRELGFDPVYYFGGGICSQNFTISAGYIQQNYPTVKPKLCILSSFLSPDRAPEKKNQMVFCKFTKKNKQIQISGEKCEEEAVVRCTLIDECFYYLKQYISTLT